MVVVRVKTLRATLEVKRQFFDDAPPIDSGPVPVGFCRRPLSCFSLIKLVIV
jgi:hypothetical protein